MKLFLTSFSTWLPHQKSNSSNDLLELIEQKYFNICFLRQLPVNIEESSKIAIAEIAKNQPSAIICCGMAESRSKLTIESNARCQENCLKTTVNLPRLVSRLSYTEISHDAGQFVCEGLYYQILNYLQFNKLDVPCIFVHVPILTTENTREILQDFCDIMDFLLTK